jgi:DNA repair protein RecO (recombination protein O)
MGYVKVKGLVIKEVNVGDADKIITIFTKQRGRISASARGARRPKSRLAGGTQLLGYNDYVLFTGKELYSVNSCEVIESFYEIRNDIVKLTYAAHILDILLDTLQENQAAPRTLQLLLNSFHYLSKGDKDPALIARIFELRYLALAGYAPIVNCCAVCGKEANSYSFSFKHCGFICGDTSCKTNDSYCREILPGTAMAIMHIVYSPISKLFKFSVSPEVLKELEYINRRYLRERLDKDYTKLDMLKKID